MVMQLGMPVWYPKKKKHGQLMELDAHNYWRVRFQDGSWGRYSGKRLVNEFKGAPKFNRWQIWPKPDKREAAVQAPETRNERIRQQHNRRATKRGSAGTMWLRLTLIVDGAEICTKVYSKYNKKELT